MVPTQISCANLGEVFSGPRVSAAVDIRSACLVLLEFSHFFTFLVYVFASLYYFLLHELGYLTPGECYICLYLSL